MILFFASKGSTPCGHGCPYYEESGEVHCIGGPKKTHCKLIMRPYWLDCNEFDVRTLRHMEVNEEQLLAMEQVAGQASRKIRKIWNTNHKTTHPIGQKRTRKKSK